MKAKDPLTGTNMDQSGIRLLWVSGSKPKLEQINELCSRYGDLLKILHYPQSPSSGAEVVAIKRNTKCDDIVLDTALGIQVEILKMGEKPLRLTDSGHFERIIDFTVTSIPMHKEIK